ncbi:MAG: hypothetical protein NZM04_03810 [Methylacidiphilales bacterium]|nr:hypothetical protein [Candidatus Methylacidiphilales bacterium]
MPPASPPPTVQIFFEPPPLPPQMPVSPPREVVYTDASNASEQEVTDALFESAHNTRLSSTEDQSTNQSTNLPQQSGDPQLGLSISPTEGRTNIPVNPPTQPPPPKNSTPTPSKPQPPAEVILENPDELITESKIDEATLIEEREARKRAEIRQALKQAQMDSQQTSKPISRRPAPSNPQSVPSRGHRESLTQKTPSAAENPTLSRGRSEIQGSAPRGDTTSIGSRASPVGRYKNRLYQEVGSRWNQEIDRRGGPSTLPLGSVRIAFTVRHTGEITDIRVVSRSASNNIIALENLCLYALRASSPFEPFDPQVRQQLGDSFQEEFTFTIYR